MAYTNFLVIMATMIVGQSLAFAPARVSLVHPTVLKAGGFEWDDPTEEFDQGVDNPFKNPGLMNGEEGLKVDPARLLGPRLKGSNLFFIGMMGSGKSSVGDVVARRKYFKNQIVLLKNIRSSHIFFPTTT
jgi:hypothetical protein